MSIDELAIGIDFGTCFSCAALIESDRPIVIKSRCHSEMFTNSIPTAIFISDQGFLIGQKAVNKNTTNEASSRYKDQFKRDFGSERDNYLFHYRPEDLAQEILRHFREETEYLVNKKPTKAIISHPANWLIHKKELLYKAGLQSGFQKVELIEEPTAAALSYCKRKNKDIPPGSKVLVYDLGGGTFDVSLIEKTSNSFQQIAEPRGDENCGGIDFDRELIKDICRQFNLKWYELPHDFREHIKYLAQKSKHILTLEDECEILISLGAPKYKITRTHFENLIYEKYLENTFREVENIIQKSGLTNNELDIILLVGGSSSMPIIERTLAAKFNNTKALIVHDLEPDLSIAFGAAYRTSEKVETVNLNKSKKLTDSENFKKLKVDLEWNGENVDFDLSLFMLNDQDKIRDLFDFIFYNNLVSRCYSIKHSGDCKANRININQESIEINLETLPPEIKKLIVCISIYQANINQHLANSLYSCHLKILNLHNKRNLLQTNFPPAKNICGALTLGEFYKDNGNWHFKAVSSKFPKGLVSIASLFGANEAHFNKYEPKKQSNNLNFENHTSEKETRNNSLKTTPEEPPYKMKEDSSFKFKEGDCVSHNQYGLGIIKRIIINGEKKLYAIEFQKYGRRLVEANNNLKKLNHSDYENHSSQKNYNNEASPKSAEYKFKPKTNKCINCNKSLKPNSTFCSECGVKQNDLSIKNEKIDTTSIKEVNLNHSTTTKPVDQTLLIVGVLLNLFTIPGIGYFVVYQKELGIVITISYICYFVIAFVLTICSSGIFILLWLPLEIVVRVITAALIFVKKQ